MRRYEPPAGMTCQPFKFALDATDEQVAALFSHFGARRYAYNWAVEQLLTASVLLCGAQAALRVGARDRFGVCGSWL